MSGTLLHRGKSQRWSCNLEEMKVRAAKDREQALWRNAGRISHSPRCDQRDFCRSEEGRLVCSSCGGFLAMDDYHGAGHL